MCKLPSCVDVEYIQMTENLVLYIHYNEQHIPLWMEVVVKQKDDQYKAIQYLPVDIKNSKDLLEEEPEETEETD